MPTLTLAQIDTILAQAAASGLESSEVEGLRAALLMRTAKPGNTNKLRLSVELLPETQKVSVDDYLAEVGALERTRLTRGRAQLDALSDDEWEQIVREANGDDDKAQTE